MKKFWLGAMALFLMVSCGQAQERVIDITGKGGNKYGINLGGFKTGGDAASKTFLRVLQADLNRSGYFKVTAGSAQLSVAGSCRSNGSQLAVECQVFKTASKQRVMGKRFQWKASEPRRLAHKVADEIVRAVTGKKGMASGKLALVGSKTGRKELYTCDMDGGNMRLQTQYRSIVMEPEWAPDGKRLFYTSHRHGKPNVYVLGRTAPLVNFEGSTMGGAMSPDNRTLALILSKDGSTEVYLLDVVAKKMKQLTNTPRACEASPTWSPDGTRVAFVSDREGRPQIYSISRNGGSWSRLSNRAYDSESPNWGAQGVAFSVRKGGRNQIAVVNPTTKKMSILKTDGANYEDPCWAPDGRHIVCARELNYRTRIYLLDTLEDSPVALFSDSSNWFSPACAP